MPRSSTAYTQVIHSPTSRNGGHSQCLVRGPCPLARLPAVAANSERALAQERRGTKFAAKSAVRPCVAASAPSFLLGYRVCEVGTTRESWLRQGSPKLPENWRRAGSHRRGLSRFRSDFFPQGVRSRRIRTRQIFSRLASASDLANVPTSSSGRAIRTMRFCMSNSIHVCVSCGPNPHLDNGSPPMCLRFALITKEQLWTTAIGKLLPAWR
jgi:hypothetical protein